MSDAPEPVDVLIAGAGPAGAALALGLRRATGASVVLVDRPARAAFRIGEAATPDVPGLIAALGVTPGGADAPYLGNVSVWGGERLSADFAARGHGAGWRLDRAAFDASLQAAAIEAGARRLSPAAVVEVGPAGATRAVRLDDGTRLAARVVVDATGRRAAVATRLGIHRRSVDALVALAVRLPQGAATGLGHRVLVESRPFGWVYLTPLPDERAVLAIMTDNDLAGEAGLREPQRFYEAVRACPVAAAHLRLTAVPERIATFPAHSGCLSKAAGPGFVAVGDALLSLDPLTSAGISGALRDAAEATALIAAWLSGAEPAAPARRYAERADQTFRRYLSERARVYSLEGRFADELFWARRREPPSA